MLEIRLLGEVTVLEAERPLQHKLAPREIALFAYLVYQEKPQARGDVAALLWADHRDSQQARSNLRTLLTRLRRTLGGYLVTSRQTISGPAATSFWLDTTEFQRRVKAADHLWRQSAQPTATAANRLLAALELYQGEFLSGLDLTDSDRFWEWIETEREMLQRQAFRCWHKLARYARHINQAESGIHYCQQALEIDRFDEDVQGLYLWFLAQEDGRAAATAHFKAYRQQLAQKLGVKPGLPLVKLYQKIVDGTLLAGKTAVVSQLAETTEKPAPATTSQKSLHPPTPLIGRKLELRRLQELLHQPAISLITLVGSGGIGKTHLALAAAEQLVGVFRDGIVFVPLAALGQPLEATGSASGSTRKVALAIANVFHLNLRGSETVQSQLLGYLRDRQCLIILDNMERISSTVHPFLLEMLRLSPDLKLIITSREPLQLQSEALIQLNQLPVPDPEAAEMSAFERGDYPSIRLFVEQARRVFPQFQLTPENLHDIARICRTVDGIPLAIEMASTWVSHFPCAEIAAEIRRNLAFLQLPNQDRPQRQRSIINAFDYSWQLLTASEQGVFERLSIFPGSFSKEAASTIANAPFDILIALVNKSIVRVIQPGRYEIHDLLRRFADVKRQEKAEHGEVATLSGTLKLNFSHYYLQFIQRHSRELHVDDPRPILQLIRADLDNILLAWQIALETEQFALLVDSHNALSRFFHFTGLYREALMVYSATTQFLRQYLTQHGSADCLACIAFGRSLIKQLFFHNRLRQLVAAAKIAPEAVVVAREYADLHGEAEAQLHWGETLELQGNSGKAQEKYLEALSLARAEGEKRFEARSLRLLGRLAWRQGELDQADNFYWQALSMERERNDLLAEAQLLTSLGLNAELRGNLSLALTYFKDAHQVFEQMANSHRLAGMQVHLGRILQMQGEYDQAATHFQLALAAYRDVGDQRRESRVLCYLTELNLKRGDVREADYLAQLAFSNAQSAQDKSGIVLAAIVMGRVRCFSHQHEAAQHYFELAQTTSQQENDQGSAAVILTALGLNSWALGKIEDAAAYCQEGLEHSFHMAERSRCLSDLVLIALTQGELERAQQYGEEGLMLARQLNHPELEGQIGTRLGRVFMQQAQYARARGLFQLALRLFAELGAQHLMPEPQAGMALLHWQEGDREAAREEAGMISRWLDKHGPVGLVDRTFVQGVLGEVDGG